jgi:hypothetical protein
MNRIPQADTNSDPQPSPSAGAGPEATLATVVRPVLPPYVMRGVAGAGFGRTFPLLGPTTLGRAADCGIHLAHPGVSRHHLRLTPTAEGLLVEDLGSTNGWLLNETPQQRAWARHGDELGIDALRFRVVAPGAPAADARPVGGTRRAASTSVWWWVAALAALGAAVALVLGRTGA